MAKYLFVTYDEGDTTKITGTTIRDDSFVVDTALYKETQSIDVFNTISGLVKDNEIRFSSKHSGELTIDDLKQTVGLQSAFIGAKKERKEDWFNFFENNGNNDLKQKHKGGITELIEPNIEKIEVSK